MSKRYDPFCTYNKDPSQLIDWFRDAYGWLSNFHPSTFVFNGKKYPTVEHAFQASKTKEEDLAEMIRTSTSPGAAKRMGKIVPLREDWDDVKFSLMRELIHLKFENPILRTLLIQTGDAKIVEANTWGDKIWGTFKGEGENMLGVILMEEREKVKDDE